MYKFNTIEEAIEEIRKGKMIVVVDDEDRENEGDLVMAAEKVTASAINFMAKYGGGLVCLPVIRERLEELHIERMVAKNTDPNRTAFTVSIDAMECTTGISAHERAMTIRRVIDPTSSSKTSPAPDTSSRSNTGKEVCWCGPVIPRHRLTWPGWRDCFRRV